ncbi:MAG TPA: hypothetical protein VKK79_19345 [Candidatus Lokiarchaeia archaeon]|nr:hypothetical protein [Candidatus Lokiarchaeia archaeon]
MVEKNVTSKTLRQKLMNYFNEQCSLNLPATYSHFCLKNQISINNKTYSSTLNLWKKLNADSPQKIIWYFEIRRNKNLITASENEKYFPIRRSNLQSVQSQVRRYLDWQCSANSPATHYHCNILRATYGLDLLDETEYDNSTRIWHKRTKRNEAKNYWFENVRRNKAIISQDRMHLYFAQRKENANSIMAAVRHYLDNQCASNLPASKAHFNILRKSMRLECVKKMDFTNGVLSWQRKYLDDQKKMLWYKNIRSNELYAPANEIETYFPRIQVYVRQYLSNQELLGLPATRTHLNYLRQGLTPICSGDFHKGLLSWKNSIADDPIKRNWFNIVRCNFKLLNIAERKIYLHSRVSNDDDFALVLQFHDENFAKKCPSLWSLFHERFPKIPYFTYADASVKWGKNNAVDAKATKWFREVRSQGGLFTRYLGTAFDQCITADLYVAM